jgi:hypothetical protein
LNPIWTLCFQSNSDFFFFFGFHSRVPFVLSFPLQTKHHFILPCTIFPFCRERFFGPEFEGSGNVNYDRVWEQDLAMGAAHSVFGNESARSVADRAVELVSDFHSCTEFPFSFSFRLIASLSRQYRLHRFFVITLETHCPYGQNFFLFFQVRELDSKHSSRTIVLVAHGDTLQILETQFRGLDPSRQRFLRHIMNAEVRQFYPVTDPEATESAR